MPAATKKLNGVIKDVRNDKGFALATVEGFHRLFYFRQENLSPGEELAWLRRGQKIRLRKGKWRNRAWERGYDVEPV